MQNPTATPNAAGTQAACAVCKYQRRKCTNNCLLAPFFPANRHRDFLNTRKLFGVRNIIKLIENLNYQQRVMAIKTIVFEANVRASDPVGGCYRYICELHKQHDRLKAELNLVNQQLELCKAQSMFTQYQQQQQQQQQSVQKQVAESDEEQFNNFVAGQNLEGFSVFDGGGSSSSWSAYDVFDSNPVKAESVPSSARKQVLSDVGEDTKSLFVDKRDESLAFDSEGVLSDVGEDIKPLLPFLDDHKREQSFCFCFDSGGGSKIQNSVWKERGGGGTIQHQQKHDLEYNGGGGGASLFTLTTNGKEIDTFIDR